MYTRSANFALVCWFMYAPELVGHRLRHVGHGAVTPARSTVIEVDADPRRATAAAGVDTAAVHGRTSMSFLEGEEVGEKAAITLSRA